MIRMFGGREVFLQLVEPPHVALQVLLVLRVDGVGFPLGTVFGKEGFREEPCEPIKGALKSVRGDFKVILQGCAVRLTSARFQFSP